MWNRVLVPFSVSPGTNWLPNFPTMAWVEPTVQACLICEENLKGSLLSEDTGAHVGTLDYHDQNYTIISILLYLTAITYFSLLYKLMISNHPRVIQRIKLYRTLYLTYFDPWKCYLRPYRELCRMFQKLVSIELKRFLHK